MVHATPTGDVPATVQVLEFFCGVGGLHNALEQCGVPHVVRCAFDVCDMALATYSHNHAGTPTSTADIASLSEATIARHAADTWLLSPPCQPYTRQGDSDLRDQNRNRGSDGRANALESLVRLLGDCEAATLPTYLLLENVVGFESSPTRCRLVAALQLRGFHVRELWASPAHFGLPNQRTRYFLLARRTADFGDWEAEAATARTGIAGADADADAHGAALASLRLDSSAVEAAAAEGRRLEPPTGMPPESLVAMCTALEAYLLPPDSEQLADLAVPDHVLERYGRAMDLVGRHSRRSCCFTKNYSRYVKGTGSVLLEALAPGAPPPREAPPLDELRALRPRFFAPTEIAAIHGFPPSFDFPPKVATKKKWYELLGNSLSVPVVAALLRVLFAPSPPADATAQGGSASS